MGQGCFPGARFCLAPDERDSTTDLTDRHARAVALAWDVVLDHESGRSILGRVDNLLGFLLAAFATPRIDRDVVSAALCDEIDTELDVEIIAGLPDCVVPVAVLRELLHRHRVVFDPTRVPRWQEFVERYGDIILAV